MVFDTKETIVSIPSFYFEDELAQAEEAKPTNYRSYGAKITKKSWRKRITKLLPDQKGGYMYDGMWLESGEETYLRPGELVLAFDSLYVSVNFYAGDRGLNGYKKMARLFEVQEDGSLDMLKKSSGKQWANTLLVQARKRLAQSQK